MRSRSRQLTANLMCRHIPRYTTMLIFLPRMISGNHGVGTPFVTVGIHNWSVAHESEAQAFSSECIYIVHGDAGWD